MVFNKSAPSNRESAELVWQWVRQHGIDAAVAVPSE